jgi:hypothetical protein
MRDDGPPDGASGAALAIPDGGLALAEPALARREPHDVRVARSFVEARPDELVMLGRSGEVVPTWSWTTLRAGIGVAAGLTAIAALPALVGVAIGPLTGLGALGLTWLGVALWTLPQAALGRATRQLAAEDLEGAQRTLDRMSGGLRSAWVAGATEHLRAKLAWLRGEHPAALGHLQRAAAALRRARGWQAKVTWTLVELDRVQLLAIVGRAAEARALLDAMHVPAGDFVQMERVHASLTVDFHGGRSTCTAAELDAWTEQTLRSNSWGGTLVLLAWAHAQRGDGELVASLLDVADDRLHPWRLPQTDPRLHAWRQAALGGGDRTGRAAPRGPGAGAGANRVGWDG